MAKTKTITKQKATTKQETRSAVVRGQILDIQQQKEKGYVSLATLLYEAYTGKYHVEWEYTDFKSYAETELAIKYRKAMNFVEIGEKVTKLGLPRKKIEEIGWSKLSLLVPVLDQDNMHEWLGKAIDASYSEIGELVRKERIEKGELAEKPKSTVLKLKMSEAEASIIESALDEGKRLTNSENTVVALEMICSDWLEFKGRTPQKTQLEDYVKYLETVYSCKISAEVRDEPMQDDFIDDLDEQEIENGQIEAKTGNEEVSNKIVIDEENVPGNTEKIEAEKTETKEIKRRAPRRKRGVIGNTTGDKEIDELFGL